MHLRIIAGEFKGRLLKTPKRNATRPTQSVVREALFNICQEEVVGARFLDLYAGSGAVGFEALSRGAAHVVFVEKSSPALQCLRGNAAALQVERKVEILAADVPQAIKRLSGQPSFELIYLDPPYSEDPTPAVEKLLLFGLLTPLGHLFLETQNAALDFSGLSLLKSRRFGTTLLHQYQLLDTK